VDRSIHSPASGFLRRHALALAVLAGLAGGAICRLSGARGAADATWALTTALALLPLALSTVAALRQRRLGVDLIALLAMAGALWLGEFLAGAVIALMLTGGQTLERFAQGRAVRELRALLDRAPRRAWREEEGRWVERAVDDLRPGDLLLVKPGEYVPVDGAVLEPAVLDESSFTGEALAIEREKGEPVRSGVLNAGSAFRLRASTTSAESAYAGIVRLVEQAQARRAPFVRLADRYAVVFLPLTLALAAGAWLLSGEAVRALAVLVVATPCPLILAAPVAFVGGLSRAAARGILVKGGGALEALAGATVLVLDKTGTVTTGVPVLAESLSAGRLPSAEVLRLAASLDQISPHVYAAPIVRAARERGLELLYPSGARELPGHGVRGLVGGRAVALGRLEYVLNEAPPPRWARRARRRSSALGSAVVFVAVDDELAGALVLDDPLRIDTPRTLRALRQAGLRRIVLLTGDHPEVAEAVGAVIGADEVLAERSPQEKVEAVAAERGRGGVVMVGDGLNDAAALAAADVGVAMGVRGSAASVESADIVLAVDRLDRLEEALSIARRTQGIARQSVLAGMGLSVAAMAVAAAGALPPTAGALVQELIDVAVILNALRALGGRRTDRAPSAESEQVRREHRELGPEISRLREVADRLEELPAAAARAELEGLRALLEDRLLPHERREEAQLYPLVAARIGGSDPTATMSRAHAEIAHLVRRFGRLVRELPPGELEGEDRRDLRRLLYGLEAILRLHFAQEEEHYLEILDAPARRRVVA
jgi:heavy metal translocating P-type ATPase